MPQLSYWSISADEAIKQLGSSASGLSQNSARELLKRVGPNTIKSKERVTPLGLFLNQFKSPIVLILIFATITSAFLKEWVDAVIILLIVVSSALLSFIQEYNAAASAAEKLQKQISLKVQVLRDGKSVTIPAEEVVPVTWFCCQPAV